MVPILPAYIYFTIIASLTVGFMFMNIPPVAKQFMSLFNVGYDGFSVFLSALLISHSFAQLPAGLLVDRFGVAKSFKTSILIITLCNTLPLFFPSSLWFAMVMRFILGLGTSLLFLSVIKVIGLMAPINKIPKIQGWQGAAFCFGNLFPYIFLPYLGAGAWRFSYIIGAVLAVATFIVSFFLPWAHLSLGFKDKKESNLKLGLKTVLASKAIWALGFFHGVSYGSLNNLGQWAPAILAETGGDDKMTLWSMATAFILLIGTIGRFFGGSALKFYTRPKLANKAMLMISIFYFILAVAVYYLHLPYILLLFAIVMALVCGLTYGSIFSLTGECVPAIYMATAIGFMNMIANLANVVLTLIFGNFKEIHGTFASGLLAAFVFSIVVWYFGAKIVIKLEDSSQNN